MLSVPRLPTTQSNYDMRLKKSPYRNGSKESSR